MVLRVEREFADGTVRQISDASAMFDVITPDLHARLEQLKCPVHDCELTRFRQQLTGNRTIFFHWFSSCENEDGPACEHLAELAETTFDQDQERGEEFVDF